MRVEQNHAETDGDTGYAQCALILRREIGLLDRIGVLQGQVKNAVAGRQWTDFELCLGSLAAIGDEFKALDLERAEVFAEYARRLGLGGQGAGFYGLAARLPEGDRRELSELYRRIKMQALGARFASDSLAEYLGETQAIVKGFLEAVFPDRRGNIYTRRGTQAAPDMRSMVLNRSL